MANNEQRIMAPPPGKPIPSPIPLPPFPWPGPFPEPIPAIKGFFEETINSSKDDDIKKVVAAGKVIQEKIKNPKNPLTTEAITHIADGGVSAAKVIYKVGKGELNPKKAADELIDRGAAVVGTVVKTTCEKVGEKAGAVVGAAIGSIFSPAGTATGAVIGATVGRFAGKVVGEVIIPAVKEVASFAKEVISTALEGVKVVGSAILGGIASLFGF